MIDNSGCFGTRQIQYKALTDGGIGAGGGVVLISLFLFFKSEFDSDDPHHILHGTKGRHENEWRRFGIDPNDPDSNNWAKLLPILEETYRQGKEEITKIVNDAGDKVVYYVKEFEEFSARVWLKMWQSVESGIQKISDAWADLY